MTGPDVIVAGGGPVGMAAALLAAKQGFSVTILEKQVERVKESRAIGITPPSLGILGAIGLADRFTAAGVPVSQAAAYGMRGELGRVDLSQLSTSYPYILAIPQHATEQLLEEAIAASPSVSMRRGCSATSVAVGGEQCTVAFTDSNGISCAEQARVVFVCDGARSVLRGSLGIKWNGARYPQTFLMGDFEDTTGWGAQARLYFTPHGSVESFPLPGKKRRYVVRTPEFIKEGTGTYLADAVGKRCGISLDTKNMLWESGFGVQHFLAERFAVPRIFLCGDAAHVMSPIGGQNMNTGFADAELAAWLSVHMLCGTCTPAMAAHHYHGIRRRAAWHAQKRAAAMMYCGTAGGYLWNAIRNPATAIMLRLPVAKMLNGMFSMLSIPCRDLASSTHLLPPELAG
jgi:2-polyprenyl-6-methoxyphenol hydroxylase-like FAD-dependent oxidoreductase